MRARRDFVSAPIARAGAIPLGGGGLFVYWRHTWSGNAGGSPARWNVARNSLLGRFRQRLELGGVRAETAWNLAKLPLERITRLISSIAASLGTCIIAIPLNSPLRGDR